MFTKRNALLGFLTWKVLERRMKRKRRQTWKLAAFAALAVVSAGILAAVAVAVLRRHKEEGEERRLEGFAEAGDDGRAEQTASDGAVPEPGFAE